MKSLVQYSAYWRGENRTFIKSAVSAVSLKGVSLVLVMFIAVLLARRMGPTEYGRLVYVQSVAFIFSSICTLGLRDAANRIVARYVARRHLKLLMRFILFGIVLIILVSCVSVPVVYLILLQVSDTFEAYRFPLLTIFSVVVSLALLSFLGPTLVALGRPVLSFALENVGPRLPILVVVLASMISSANLTAETALDVTILGYIAPAMILAAFIFVPFRLTVGMLKRPYHLVRNGRVWLSISLFMMTSPLISMVFSETAMIVLGAYAEPAEVAFYQVARRVSELAIVCGAVAIYIALPNIARYYTLRRYDELQHTVDIANLLTIIPSISVMLILIIGGDRLLLVFGPDFSGAYTATLILTVGRAADQLFGPALEILLMTGQQVIATWINALYGVLSISLSFALVPHYGQIGAAFATVSAGLLWKLNLYLIVRQRSSIQPCLLLALASRSQRALGARRVPAK
jgi:O-antigen/teichoic acid export membrane protein